MCIEIIHAHERIIIWRTLTWNIMVMGLEKLADWGGNPKKTLNQLHLRKFRDLSDSTLKHRKIEVAHAVSLLDSCFLKIIRFFDIPLP